MLIPKSALVFHTFASLRFFMITTSSLCDFSPWFADFHFGACRGKFVDIHKSIILAPLWFYVFRAKQISDPSISISTIHAALLSYSSYMIKAVKQHRDYLQQFQKKKCVSIKN